MADERWGAYLPWFLRHTDSQYAGDFHLFFRRLSQRLGRLIEYNEAGISNMSHFGAMLETESLQRFRYTDKNGLASQLHRYFDTNAIDGEVGGLLQSDPEEVIARNAKSTLTSFALGEVIGRIGEGGQKGNSVIDDAEVEKSRLTKEDAERRADSTRQSRRERHFLSCVAERMTTLEALFRILPDQPASLESLATDMKRFFAEAKLPLDLRGSPPLIVPLDEPLMQAEVIDKALTRLGGKFPERSAELLKAYHDMLSGRNLDSVFVEAFKTLEEVGRSISGNSSFIFSKDRLKAHFPNLHPTIHETMVRLAGHRGDEAGHGRTAPDTYEIRYLLFAICNIAVLLLDYEEAQP